MMMVVVGRSPVAASSSVLLFLFNPTRISVLQMIITVVVILIMIIVDMIRRVTMIQDFQVSVRTSSGRPGISFF